VYARKCSRFGVWVRALTSGPDQRDSCQESGRGPWSIDGLGFWVLGFGLRVLGFGLRVWGLGFQETHTSRVEEAFELPAVILTSLQLLPCKRVDRLSVEEEERGGERGRDGRERGRRAREGGKRKGSRFELLTHTCRKSRSCSCQANSSSALIGPALAPSPPPFPDM
jgi:hypothetical protein